MTELRDLTPHTSISHEQASRDGRQRRLLRTFLPELVGLERILTEAPDLITTEVVERVALKDLSLPIYRRYRLFPARCASGIACWRRARA